MFSPASSGAPNTPASGLVEESSSGMLRTIASPLARLSATSLKAGRWEFSECLQNSDIFINICCTFVLYLFCTYQHCTISSYTALGIPGGGANL